MRIDGSEEAIISVECFLIAALVQSFQELGFRWKCEHAANPEVRVVVGGDVMSREILKAVGFAGEHRWACDLLAPEATVVVEELSCFWLISNRCN